MRSTLKIALCCTLVACTGPDGALLAQNGSFEVTEVTRFNEPWALEFLPDGRLLVSEMGGALKLYDTDTGSIAEIAGVPEVSHGGQGGFGDIVLHPSYSDNGLIYLSYAERGRGGARGCGLA